MAHNQRRRRWWAGRSKSIKVSFDKSRDNEFQEKLRLTQLLLCLLISASSLLTTQICYNVHLHLVKLVENCKNELQKFHELMRSALGSQELEFWSWSCSQHPSETDRPIRTFYRAVFHHFTRNMFNFHQFPIKLCSYWSSQTNNVSGCQNTALASIQSLTKKMPFYFCLKTV